MLEKQLNELNIFALRDLARRTGVVSPTSKKKDELIKSIIEIMSGEKKPETSKTKQGRPPKTFGYDFVDVFNIQNSINNLSSLKLNQETKSYEDNDIKTVVGCLEMGTNNSAILWVEKNNKYENYFVPNHVLKKYNVKIGDRVGVEVPLDETQRVVKEIFNINGCPILKFPKERKDYFKIEHNAPSRDLVFANSEYEKLPLKIGENVYFYGPNNNINTIAIIDILNSCKIENKIYVNVSIAEKNKMFLSKLNGVEKFTTFITDEVDFSRRIVSLAIERAKRILESGEDVLLVIDDIMSITGIDKDELNLTKNLVSLTKEGNKNGSITTFAIMPNENFNHIEKLADVRLKIENETISLMSC